MGYKYWRISLQVQLPHTGLKMISLSAQTERVAESLAAQTGKALAGLTVMFAMFQNYFPCELRVIIMDCYEKLVNFVYPYIQINFPELASAAAKPTPPSRGTSTPNPQSRPNASRHTSSTTANSLSPTMRTKASSSGGPPASITPISSPSPSGRGGMRRSTSASLCTGNTGYLKHVMEDEDEDEDENQEEGEEKNHEKKKKRSKVTLSGLLNTIAGLWSACPGERIIVFTTNHVDKALIRRGRMDEHIELSYCGFEAFKILAKNYLEVDSHELFAKIRQLLKETEMSPADVADKLMRKSDGEDADGNLMRLIKALEEVQEKNKAAKLEEKEKKTDAKGNEIGDQALKRKWPHN